jgi:serine/threonine-protein kinase
MICSMHHPLLDTDRIDQPPGTYLDSAGEIFAIFGAQTQDSGNVSYGLRTDEGRFFIKTTDPEASVLLDFAERVELLRNAVSLARSCSHRVLPSLHNVIESPAGPMLVYDWVDGELLRDTHAGPTSAHQRFRKLPVREILNVLDTIFELHTELANDGRVAADFYDGCMIYDFPQQTFHVVDLDNYRQGAFRNSMGRMFGSRRFMAPEELSYGAWINERTSLFTMGRTAALFLSDGSLDRTPFRGSNGLFDVVTKACQPLPKDRYQSMGAFYRSWQKAR